MSLDADTIVVGAGIVGAAGLLPNLAAARAGKAIMLEKPMAPMGMAPMDGFDDLSSGGQFGPMGEETKQEPKNAL